MQNIGRTAGKLLATVGALIGAVVFAALIAEFSYRFVKYVIGHDLYQPSLLSSPRLDVVCALLIPIGMALWWQRPIPNSRPVVASCAGIAAAFVPIVAQIISWPFITLSPNGVWAAAAVALFATALLSIKVTQHVLTLGSPDANPTIPLHIRRGLIRLYAILIIPWVIWFGYSAYRADRGMRYDFSHLRRLSDAQTYERSTNDVVVRMAKGELELLQDVWEGAHTTKSTSA
jgi:hypothetical protein